MRRLIILALALALPACGSNDPERAIAADGPGSTSTVLEISTKSAAAREAFLRGEILLGNVRPQEAAAAFDEALSHDPNFALARALRGEATPGAEGLKQIEAAAVMGGVTEGERVLMEGMVANRRGDLARAKERITRVTEIAPGDWRGHQLLGLLMLQQEEYAGATQALRRAADLNPTASGALNMLGYASLRQEDTAGAIAAFEEYARLLPDEPNPQDSLGEALLAAGRFTDAEAAFTRAAALSPQFAGAWEGVGYARYFAGDVTGAREALAKARDAFTRPRDKADVDIVLAAIAVAENRPAEALRALDAADKTAGATASDLAFVPVSRAMVLTDTGAHRESLRQATLALSRVDASQYPPGLTRTVRREALRARITAEARLGDRSAAAATAAEFERDAAASADDAAAQTNMHYGRGMRAVTENDLATARSHFERCSTQDQYCKYQLVLAAQKAGDSAAANAARERILKLHTRSPGHIVIRARLTAPVGGST